GPTPPNTYKLVMREEPFHGIRAIRLVPVGDGKMFGRDGLLAHSYMLGPNGQSNGCVSFGDYPAFLDAYLKGEVDRLVVVEHLATAPRPTPAWGWLPEFIKDLFGRSCPPQRCVAAPAFRIGKIAMRRCVRAAARRRERPRSCRPADQRDELAAFH